MPRERQEADQAEEVNWDPRSEVSLAGTPKLEIPLREGGEAGLSRRISIGIDGRPARGTVHHRENVSVAGDCRQGANKVDVDVGETARGHIDVTDRRADMPRHLGLLTIHTG